jgi:hypothetical protein
MTGMASFNKQKHLYFAVNLNLLIIVCLKIVTFGAKLISESYSLINSVNLDQPTNQ